MKTAEKNIERTTGRFGRCLLAALLISFTCISPMTYNAFAEENATAATTEADTAQANQETTIDDEVTNDTAINRTASDETRDAEAADVEANAETAPIATVSNEANVESAPALITAEDTATATNAEDGHTFNIGSTLELMDAFKYDINTQSNQSFVINLTDDITLAKPSDRYDTHGKKLFIGTDRLCVKNGNTVTILGHGHSLIYNDKSVNNLAIGTVNGNLILGAADGSDSLTITFAGNEHTLSPLVTITGGTLAMHEGVTLSNNNNFTAMPGGGINATNGAVITMDGGLIANNTNGNIPWGGGVYLDGAEFHMTGGKITGSSESQHGNYLGYGGGVAVGAHGNKTTFTMSGDAVIEGNTAPYGGGVYVFTNGTFTMDGDAAIRSNTANVNGGGVYVEQGATFTMGENATITGNSAPYGGGVLNFGTATITNVYDNDANTAGADVYNDGTITMEPVKAEWSLSRDQATSNLNTGSGTDTPTANTNPGLPGITFQSYALTPQEDAVVTTNASNKNIDNWYYDGHRETGDVDENGNAIVDRTRWNANADTADMPQYLMNYTATNTPTTEVMGLKAAHGTTTTTPEEDTITVTWENEDGTILYTMDHVDPEDVPAAEEYNELSGNEDPTEPNYNDYSYDFEGWIKTTDGEGDVIYIANYKAVPETHQTDTPETPTDPKKPIVPDDPIDPENHKPFIDPEVPDGPEDPGKMIEPKTTEPEEDVPGDEQMTVFPADEPATLHEDEVTLAPEEEADEENSEAPRLGDDPLPLIMTMSTATILAVVALDRARRIRKEVR